MNKFSSWFKHYGDRGEPRCLLFMTVSSSVRSCWEGLWNLSCFELLLAWTDLAVSSTMTSSWTTSRDYASSVMITETFTHWISTMANNWSCSSITLLYCLISFPISSKHLTATKMREWTSSPTPLSYDFYARLVFWEVEGHIHWWSNSFQWWSFANYDPF